MCLKANLFFTASITKAIPFLIYQTSIQNSFADIRRISQGGEMLAGLAECKMKSLGWSVYAPIFKGCGYGHAAVTFPVQ